MEAFDLFTYSDLNAGIDINLLTFLWANKKFRFNTIAGIFQTKFSTNPLTNQTGTVTSSYFLPEVKLEIIEGDYVDGDLTVGLLYYDLIGNDLKLNSNPTKLFNWRKFKVKSPALHKYQFSLNIHPNPLEQDKSIFLRGTYYVNDPDDNFSLQIGYTSPISKLFGSARERQKALTQ